MSASLCVAEMDRELFSELKEPPIQPALLHTEPLKIRGLGPNFHLHISCQLLWSWNNTRQTSLFLSPFRQIYFPKHMCCAKVPQRKSENCFIILRRFAQSKMKNPKLKRNNIDNKMKDTSKTCLMKAFKLRNKSII